MRSLSSLSLSLSLLWLTFTVPRAQPFVCSNLFLPSSHPLNALYGAQCPHWETEAQPVSGTCLMLPGSKWSGLRFGPSLPRSYAFQLDLHLPRKEHCKL